MTSTPIPGCPAMSEWLFHMAAPPSGDRPGWADPAALPAELDEALRAALCHQALTPGTTMTVLGDGRRFRVHCEVLCAGWSVYIRQIPSQLPGLASLLPGYVQGELIDPGLNDGGLVLVGGRPGQGKSTTVASALIERLAAFGGVCYVLDDLAEMPLEGRHGDGQCFQCLVDDDQYHQRLKTLMRAFPVALPGQIYVAEVRDHHTAREVITASINGLLVWVTLHAGSITETIDRLLKLSDADELVRATVARSLQLVIHQALLPAGDDGLTADVSLLKCHTDAIRAKIHEGRLAALEDDIRSQQNQVRFGFGGTIA